MSDVLATTIEQHSVILGSAAVPAAKLFGISLRIDDIGSIAGVTGKADAWLRGIGP